MGLINDECVAYRTVHWHLKKKFSPAYKVLHVSDIMPSASDYEVWDYAKRNDLVVVTQDKKFPDEDNVVRLNKKNLKQVERKLVALLIEC